MEALLLIAVVFGAYLYYKRKQRVKELEHQFLYSSGYSYSGGSSNDDLIKGVRLLITPKITTRLKVLKLRHKIFNSEREAENWDFRMNEAVPVAETKSWEELGMAGLGKEIDGQIKKAIGDKAWTDIGMMKPGKLEQYFRFLERFRIIIENKSLAPTEKVKRVRKMNDEHGFLRRLKKEYGKHFPKNLFIDDLTKVEGITKGIAYQLFDKGIYKPRDISNISKKELSQLKGVGKARLEKITDYLAKEGVWEKDN